MRIATILVTSLMLTAVAPAGAAVFIPGLYNTGVDEAGGSVTGTGIADQHWTLAGGTAYVSAENGQFPIGPWIADTATSRWITPRPQAGTTLDPFGKGNYTYALTFSLDGYDPLSASFAGRFAADNSVRKIRLNGNVLTAAGGGFTDWTDFTATSGFVAGLNKLEFLLTNGGQQSGNPTGLRVEFLDSDIGFAGAVPEPASWVLLIGGFGLIGVAMRRRDRSVTA